MRLLGIENSRLTAIFNITRLDGQVYLPHAAIALMERYKFASGPASFEQLTADRIEFKHGLFESSAINALEIYNDGIVITSSSDTEFLDNFLDDLLSWSSEGIGFSVVPSRSISKMRESHLIVEADPSILTPLHALQSIASSIDETIAANGGPRVQHEPMGYTITSDPNMNPGLKPVVFRLERRLAAEFGFNQFVSVAPMTTKQHLLLLEEMESMFLRPTA